MNVDVQFLVQSIISMLVITSPMDPIKILFFNQAIADPPRDRTRASAMVALNVALMLGGTALVGRQILNGLGIDLDAFSVVGGFIIAAMGFEMLYG
jgi:multiple antibiotic resistance protein